MLTPEQIDQILPQTQCGQCGYSGCRPYAEAIAKQQTTIDRCPPGGTAVVKQLAQLLQIAPEPWLTNIAQQTVAPKIAFIREAECIGCTKCLQACPVDAIIGSAKQLHNVIQQECTGCGLCVAPCPVDCIDMMAVSQLLYEPAQARRRYHAKQQRLVQPKDQSTTPTTIINDKKATIAAAVARVKAKRSQAAS